jgi:hypothetical protein
LKLNNYLFQLCKKREKNKENICLYGDSSIINSLYFDLKKVFHRELIKKIFSELKVPYQTIYCWIKGKNPIPILKAYNLLRFWQKYCEKSEEEFIDKWNLIYGASNEFSQNGQRKVKLPKELNKDLTYVMGFFQGDGHLKKTKTRNFWEYSIYFYESSKEVLENFNDIIYKLFNIRGNIYYQSNKTGKWYSLRISSKPIYLFLKNVLGLQSGKKVREVGVPRIIKETGLPFQLSFIKGFFDAEGGVGETKKNPWLEIGQASKNIPCEILMWVREKLKENDIILSEPKRTENKEYFRIRTAKRETIKRFFDIVSSNHMEKITKFNNIINR